jgi:hypothetical protein
MTAARNRRKGPAAVLLAVASTVAAVGAGAGAASAHEPGARHDEPRLTRAQRIVLLEATRRFRHVREAVSAGYQPTQECVPGMGFHYAKPALAADGNVDPTLPEVLVYAPAGDGAVRLVALEYFRADADGDLKTAGDRPTLFGHPFDGPMKGHAPGMPVHYDLHVWLYDANPDGELTSMNPEIDCE